MTPKQLVSEVNLEVEAPWQCLDRLAIAANGASQRLAVGRLGDQGLSEINPPQ